MQKNKSCNQKSQDFRAKNAFCGGRGNGTKIA